MICGRRPWSSLLAYIIRRGTPRTFSARSGFPRDRPSWTEPLHQAVVAPIQPGMVSKLQDREAIVASVSREDWRAVARRLALLALLVVGITAHVAQFFLSLRQFESGPPVASTTYVARFTEIATTEGRPYRDFPVEYPPVSLAAIEAAAGPNGNETG